MSLLSFRFAMTSANRTFVCGFSLAALGILTAPLARAAEPLSYSTIALDNTGLNFTTACGATNGFVAATTYDSGTGIERAQAWNIATNTRMILDSTGLSSPRILGATSGYGVGAGSGTATGNTYLAMAWNLNTNIRTVLNSSGLGTSYVYGTSDGYAVGEGSGTATAGHTYVMTWNVLTNTRLSLDSTNLDSSYARGGGSGYVVGGGVGTATAGTNSVMAWSIATGNRTILDNTGLTSLQGWAATDGYALGEGSGTATGNQMRAIAWNIATNSRILLNNTGLTASHAYTGQNGYAFGMIQGTATSNQQHAAAWDIASNTRTDIQSAFLPADAIGSTVDSHGEDGSLVGRYNDASGTKPYVLVPFRAWQGDTLNAGTTARVTSNVNQTKGVTTINGTYIFVGGAGNNTYTLSSGTLQGTGTLTGNLVNTGGILAPGNSPGTFTVNGNYTQGSGGVMNIELANLTSFDKLMVSGNATLGGTLNLSFAPDFPNNFPASFDLITTSGTISGFFDQINIVGGLPNGATAYSFNTTSTGNGMKLTLVVVPEADTLALIAMPLLGVMVRGMLRRRVSR